MSIIRRAKRNKNFTVLPNAVVNDANLDWDTGMVLVYLLSKPDDWTVNRQHLVNLDRGLGDKGLRRVFKQLEEFGYLRRLRENGPDGKFVYLSEIVDIPWEWENDHITAGETTRPSAARASQARPSAARRQQAPLVSTDSTKYGDVVSTEETNVEPQLFETDPLPSGKTVDKPTYTDAFLDVLALWPSQRRGSKRDTYIQWNKRLNDSDATVEQLVRGAENYIKTKIYEKTEPKFYLLAQTFFGPGEHWANWQELPDNVKKDRASNVMEREDESESGEVSLKDIFGE